MEVSLQKELEQSYAHPLLACTVSSSLLKIQISPGNRCQDVGGVMQLAEVAAWRAEGAPAEVAACVGAAQHTLLEVLTNPRHGIASPADLDAWDYSQDNQPSESHAFSLLSFMSSLRTLSGIWSAGTTQGGQHALAPFMHSWSI